MYTAYPEPDNTKDLEQRAEQARQEFLGRMALFTLSVSAADFAGISGKREKIEYTEKHKSQKVKGGRPPIDYSAVEDFVDLQRAIAAGDVDAAAPIYFRLRRLLN